MKRIIIGYICMFMIVAEMAQADTNSIGPHGINAAGLGLTGSSVAIGQVELVRPGKPNFDILHNDLVDPDFVYYRDTLPPNDENIQDIADGLHALQVAGVMIAEHSTGSVNGANPGAVMLDGFRLLIPEPSALLFVSVCGVWMLTQRSVPTTFFLAGISSSRCSALGRTTYRSAVIQKP